MRPSRARRRCGTQARTTSATTGTSATRRRSTPRFAKAAHVTKLDLVNNRLIPNAMEPRAAIGDYDRATGDYTLYTTSQNPHVHPAADGRLRAAASPSTSCASWRPTSAAASARRSSTTPRRRSSPGPPARSAARSSGRPSAAKSFMSDAHGRDHVTHAELAHRQGRQVPRPEGRARSPRWAPISRPSRPCVPTYLYATLLAGDYTTPAIYAEVKAVFTNTVPVDAYRGAGRPEATYLLERIVDKAAREMKHRSGGDPPHATSSRPTPSRTRRRSRCNTTAATTSDAGDGAEGSPTTPASRRGGPRRQGAGKLRGIGISTYIEACGIAPSAVVGSLGARVGLCESAEVRVHPTGIVTGLHRLAQPRPGPRDDLRADRRRHARRADRERSRSCTATPRKVPFGMGTYGSRSLAVGGSALVKALDKIIAKGKKIAAHLLEASVADIEFKDGKFNVAGTDKTEAVRRGRVRRLCAAQLPDRPSSSPASTRTAFYDPNNFTYPGRLPHLRGRDRSRRPASSQVVNFVGGRRFRQGHQPDDRRGPGPWRHRPGHRPGAARGLRLRQRDRPAPDRLLHGLHHAAGRRPAVASRCGTHDTLCTAQSARRRRAAARPARSASPPAVINAVLDALAPLGVTDIDMPATPAAGLAGDQQRHKLAAE